MNGLHLNEMNTMVIVTACTQITRWLTQTILKGEVLEVKSHCAKICKNVRGLKVLKSRTTCGREEKQMQRIMETVRKHPTVQETSQHLLHPKFKGGTLLTLPLAPTLCERK